MIQRLLLTLVALAAFTSCLFAKDPTYLHWEKGSGEPGYARFLVKYDTRAKQSFRSGDLVFDLATGGWYTGGSTTGGSFLSILEPYGNQLAITVADDEDDTGTITLQVQDASGVDQAAQFLVEVWVDADGGAPGSSIGTITVSTGTTVQTVTSNAHYRILTNASGTIVLGITPSAVPDDVYVTAVLASKVYAANATIADAP